MSTVTATVFPASPDPFTVTLAAAPVDPAGPEDFVLEGTLLSFAAAATESTGEVSVTAVDNDEDAPDGTVTVSGTVSLGTVTAPLPVTLTITDDEPAVTLVLTPPSIAENGGVSTVTATVFPASPDPFTVTLAAAPEDPVGPEDFVLEGTLLSFAAASTESTGEVRVTAVDNDEDAPDRTVTVSGTVSLETVTAPLPVTLTITDDDEGTPPVERGVDIFPTELTIGEGDEAGGTFSVTLTAEPSEPVTVTVFVPAVSNLIVDPSELVFTPPADWNIPQTVKVTAPEDDDAEPRTVRLSYSATGSGYDDVPVTDVDVTVTDRIDPGRPELRIADARGPEAGGALLFELTLSHAAEGPVTVEYATRDGTARAGEDYEAIQGTATGVIEDEARMASAWLARLGRLVGQDVMAAVEERITAPRAAGSELTVAGLRPTGCLDRLEQRERRHLAVAGGPPG